MHHVAFFVACTRGPHADYNEHISAKIFANLWVAQGGSWQYININILASLKL